MSDLGRALSMGGKLSVLPSLIPDGTPGVRDAAAPCSTFEPGESGRGDCGTDGHWLCRECRHMSSEALEERMERER